MNMFILLHRVDLWKNAFLKIESTFSIKSIELDVLGNHDINRIASKYPAIMHLKKNPVYEQILNIPFLFRFDHLEGRW